MRDRTEQDRQGKAEQNRTEYNTPIQEREDGERKEGKRKRRRIVNCETVEEQRKKWDMECRGKGNRQI